jgi:hypothetical protein
MRGVRISVSFFSLQPILCLEGEPPTKASDRREETHMPFHVEVTPGVGDEARVVTTSPQGPRLMVELSGAQLSVQVNRADPGGAELAAMFARSLATEAIRFARFCDDIAGHAVVGVGQLDLNR